MIAEVTAGDHVYTVVEDLVTRFQVIFVGNVLDEISGKGLPVPFSVTVDREDFLCKTTEGLFCIAADVDAIFPDLTVASPAIQMTVQAVGYREQSQMIAFSANPVFPVPVATLDLRRLPVRLQGRVNQEAGTNPPIPDAKIMTAAPGAQTALLRAPVRLGHPVGTTVRARPLNPVTLAAPARELAAPLSRGQQTLLINDRNGLAAGQIIRIGSEASGQLAIVQSISTTPANLALPGEITLEQPPNRSFPGRTPITVFTAGTAGTTRQLTRSTNSGDGVLLLNGPLTAATIQIVDPPQPSEYHALGALTDTDGYYACDGIAGVAALHLKASAAGFTTPPAPVSRILDYNQPTNIVDFRL